MLKSSLAADGPTALSVVSRVQVLHHPRTCPVAAPVPSRRWGLVGWALAVCVLLAVFGVLPELLASEPVVGTPASIPTFHP